MDPSDHRRYASYGYAFIVCTEYQHGDKAWPPGFCFSGNHSRDLWNESRAALCTEKEKWNADLLFDCCNFDSWKCSINAGLSIFL